MNSSLNKYDYVFIGLGCANSLIILALHQRGLLANKKILVFEPEEKQLNDKTFCFWLAQKQIEFYGLTTLITHSWPQLKINKLPVQSLENKRYYYLRAENLYAQVRDYLDLYQVENRNILFEDQPDFSARYVFDSRPPKWQNMPVHHVHIKQSFYGQIIQSNKPVFDPTVFTMMDFEVEQYGHTQFMYVLPFSAHEALIEPTRFGKVAMTKPEALELISAYMSKLGSDYKVVEQEQGCIPMCSALPMLKTQESKNWLKTGSSGGQLKPSTGYSFVRNLIDSEFIVDCIENNSDFRRRISPLRFRYYDRLLLHILARFPSKGKQIFSQLFERNQAKEVLHFLDENTNLRQEFKIMKSLPICTFLRAAILDFGLLFLNFLKHRSLLLLFCMLFLALHFFKLNLLNNSILVLGLFAIGIPHGALDHLYQNPKNNLWNLKFIATYLGLGLGMFLLWQLLPVLALLIFLTYTAWHFGQADFHHWGIKSTFGSFLWGALLLAIILLGHWQQTAEILLLMNVPIHKATFFTLNWMEWTVVVSLILILGRWLNGNKYLLETIFVLVLSWQLPLLTAFGLYFIFQHSWHGWTFLEQELKSNFMLLWKKAAIFSFGAILLFVGSIYIQGLTAYNWGLFFIFLSALSFPHVLFMHRFYLRSK